MFKKLKSLTLEKIFYYLLIITVCSYFSACVASEIHFGYRVGAICSDGWRSSSTGRGTCSHHGGVSHWLYSDGDGPIGFLSKPFYTTGHISLGGLGITYLIWKRKQKKNL